jgi:histidyl-tRNA synthetase
MSKPSIPQGTRDFGPQQVAKRSYIFNTIRAVFNKYGFQPIETPTFENLSTLTGKYGEEGDKLLFKVLNNGDFLSKANAQALADKNSSKLVASICDRGLRYDLTVPFARFVVMHQNEVVFPFKRYQIQPVWRADRPQRGRYREFYQCDADVVGSNSLVYEAEFIQIYNEAFAQLGLRVEIKINNRKILQGIAEAAGCAENFIDMTTAIDKLDKVGIDGVCQEMRTRGITEKSIDILKIKQLSDLKANYGAQSTTLLSGIEELETVENFLEIENFQNKWVFDITLARGLNYYTGCIFEVKALDVAMGSIGGGGRYDDLTGVFGLKNVSGVGVSFGADRIYDCLEELNLFPENTAKSIKLLFISFDAASFDYAFRALGKVRAAGIAAEIYPEPLKLKKQMDYADRRQVPYVAVVGSDEMETGKIVLKNMETGLQEKFEIHDIIKHLLAEN